MKLRSHILSEDELAEIKIMQDKYLSDKKAFEETVSENIMGFWDKVRNRHGLHKYPYHVIGSMIWYVVDASHEEELAFQKMFSKQ